MRVFETGATRNPSLGKPEYFGAIHPLCDRSFVEYMDRHRKQEDGNLRDSNNWWLGIPSDVCLQSLCRHIEDLKALHANYIVYEYKDELGEHRAYSSNYIQKKGYRELNKEEVLNAIRFNCEAYKLNLLREL